MGRGGSRHDQFVDPDMNTDLIAILENPCREIMSYITYGFSAFPVASFHCGAFLLFYHAMLRLVFSIEAPHAFCGSAYFLAAAFELRRLLADESYLIFIWSISPGGIFDFLSKGNQ